MKWTVLPDSTAALEAASRARIGDVGALKPRDDGEMVVFIVVLRNPDLTVSNMGF
tara:strand:+ start:361 stop:525 length:165 start_codon:yes stop_codon:yes gene_type:complete